ncbi:amino acid ABC transporter permease [Petroclostridium sp. X23]|uniref:amino acid ABC transporter permease n=1 Tax=Petroclostridium sp. X23 TaxID=3045146 RepID=UPI0024ACB796|nr:amino acid ABC transporter permease [Petroclostridium sp. X23]WHH59973.1 amino acid ABC transporter permease [Petroclostridium sp. X23]
MGTIFDWDYMIKSIPEIARYLPVTIGIASVSIVCGLIIGLFTALVKIYQIPVLKQLAALYISFIRGTPLLVQIYIVYYGLPKVLEYVKLQYNWDINISGIPAIVFVNIACAINVGAYLSETIRAAIESVDRGQIEAAYSVGMTIFQTMKRIVFPQALIVALPNFGNTFLSIIKDSSLAFIISVVEIMGQAKIIGSRQLRFFEVYIAVSLIYWVVCIVISKFIALLEQRLRRYERRMVE